MKRLIAAGAFLAGMAAGMYATAVAVQGHAQTPSAEVAAALDDAAAREGVAAGCLWHIAYRESRYLPGVDNFQGSGAAGLFQFMPGTWQAWAPAAGYSPALWARYDPWAAAHVAAWMLARPRITGGLAHWGGRC